MIVNMLGYVFWHWPLSEVLSSDYELALLRFYKALRRRRPSGFRGCFGFRLSKFPWKQRAVDHYEDWYLVEDFASLGALNKGAVSGVAKEPHDEVASLAGGGAGGIYRRIGDTELGRIRNTTWFAKPKGTSYKDLETRLRSVKVGAFWQRQMVLGPAPEFCAHATGPLLLPSAFRSTTIEVEPLE